MQKIHITVLISWLLLLLTILFSSFIAPPSPKAPAFGTLPANIAPDLKAEVFQLLDTKCNVCHRKKNPFRVFTLKNMERNARRIHQQVFVYKRMPKGSTIKLTDADYQLLKQWLNTQNLPSS
jgi:uncharacterized membrane protein